MRYGPGISCNFSIPTGRRPSWVHSLSDTPLPKDGRTTAKEMMWEAGLGDGDPETHIGQLQNALLRNARFLSAIGMHSGKMTTAQSEKLFTDEAFQDPVTARQQAARGTYDPAYLNYTLGKLMIRKLRDDWTASRGGRSAWKAFHDAFLNYGGPPIPLVRKAMLGAKAGAAL